MRMLSLTGGVTLVVLLGMLIDAQSRTPVHHSAGQTTPETIFASGRIEGASAEIELRPQLAGRLADVLVGEGDMVHRGDVLLRLDAQEYRHDVALAAAELALAEAQLQRLRNGARPQQIAEAEALLQAKQSELERAELSWQRIEGLLAARAVSQQQADDQRTLVASIRSELAAADARLELLKAPARLDEVQMDQARVEAARARLELAQVQLARTELLAPSDGQILKIDIEGGELLSPDSAEPAVVMADTSRYQVRAYVEEQDAPRVQVGMTAKIVADGMPDQTLTARVTRLSPRMTRKSLLSDNPAERQDVKTREVWLELEGEKRGLIVGFPVDVIIGLSSPSPDPTELNPREE